MLVLILNAGKQLETYTKSKIFKVASRDLNEQIIITWHDGTIWMCNLVFIYTIFCLSISCSYQALIQKQSRKASKWNWCAHFHLNELWEVWQDIHLEISWSLDAPSDFTQSSLEKFFQWFSLMIFNTMKKISL